MQYGNSHIHVPGAGSPIRPSLIMLLCLGVCGASGLLLFVSDAGSGMAWLGFGLLIISLAALVRFTFILYQQSSRVLQFEDTIEAITDIYWQWDLKTGAFQYSGKMAELLGYDDRKPTDGFWKEVIHPLDRPLQKYQLLRHLADEAIPYYCEYRFLDCNQQYQWFAGRGKVVRRDKDQQPVLMVGSLEHIQPRKDMEQSLIHSHKMEALGQLTGGIAHDFNNIMGTVLGYAELSIDASSPAKMQEYARHIHAAGSRARNVVRQLLDFSRRSQGIETTVDLCAEVATALVMVRSTLPSTIEIKEKIDEAPHFVTLDSNQLQRVLLNLCINARDAMNQKGTLTISLERVHKDDNCTSCQQGFEGDYHALTVGDTGQGLDQGMQARLFEPFFTTKPFGEGTGMGLSVVHGIVHEFGGHIVVNSAPGAGTQFSIYLPVTATESESPTLAAQG